MYQVKLDCLEPYTYRTKDIARCVKGKWIPPIDTSPPCIARKNINNKYI